jgi:hypothetical protein
MKIPKVYQKNQPHSTLAKGSKDYDLSKIECSKKVFQCCSCQVYGIMQPKNIEMAPSVGFSCFSKNSNSSLGFIFL